MRMIASLLLFFGLALASFYHFPSGQPQPTDFVLLMFATVAAFLMLASDEPIHYEAFVISWALMVVWVCIVSLSWALIMQTDTFFLQIKFFLFNLIIGLAFLYFLSTGSESTLAVVRNALSLAVLFAASQTLLQLALGGVRPTGSFNNPNQLAYFSLCALVVLLLLEDFRPKLRPLPLLAMAGCLVGIIGASSLAAMGGLVLVGIGWGIANASRLRHFARFLFLVPVLVLAVAVVDNHSGGQIQQNVQTRLERAPVKINSIYEERKFDRVVNFPQYALLGAGEGELRRFVPYHRNEIHSSFITMLFAYGLPGFGLFLLVIFMALRRAPLYAWAGIAGPLLYSVTHNGLRSTLFWMMLALCWHVYRNRQEDFLTRWPAKGHVPESVMR